MTNSEYAYLSDLLDKLTKDYLLWRGVKTATKEEMIGWAKWAGQVTDETHEKLILAFIVDVQNPFQS